MLRDVEAVGNLTLNLDDIGTTKWPIKGRPFFFIEKTFLRFFPVRRRKRNLGWTKEKNVN